MIFRLVWNKYLQNILKILFIAVCFVQLVLLDARDSDIGLYAMWTAIGHIQLEISLEQTAPLK